MVTLTTSKFFLLLIALEKARGIWCFILKAHFDVGSKQSPQKTNLKFLYVDIMICVPQNCLVHERDTLEFVFFCYLSVVLGKLRL